MQESHCYFKANIEKPVGQDELIVIVDYNLVSKRMRVLLW